MWIDQPHISPVGKVFWTVSAYYLCPENGKIPGMTTRNFLLTLTWMIGLTVLGITSPRWDKDANFSILSGYRSVPTSAHVG